MRLSVFQSVRRRPAGVVVGFDGSAGADRETTVHTTILYSGRLVGAMIICYSWKTG